MRFRPLTRTQIWFDALLDRRHNLPAVNATGLSSSEMAIQAAVNISIRALEQAHAKSVEPLKLQLAFSREQLLHVELPEWERLVAKTGRRQEDVAIRPMTHHVLMALLSVGEAAFNVVAFAVFGEAVILSAAMALAVALAIPILAHHAGMALRQYTPLARKARWATTLSGVALATLVAINQLRVSYLHAEGSQTSVAASQYFVINVSVFAAACLLTYLATDPEPGFIEAKRRVERRKADVAATSGRLRELARVLILEIDMHREGGAQAIAWYRGVNRRGRNGVPQYFDDANAPSHRVGFVDIHPDRVDPLDEVSAHIPRSIGVES
jgi:uncharacterized membrane protein